MNRALRTTTINTTANNPLAEALTAINYLMVTVTQTGAPTMKSTSHGQPRRPSSSEHPKPMRVLSMMMNFLGPPEPQHWMPRFASPRCSS